jgi:hypothetical protein
VFVGSACAAAIDAAQNPLAAANVRINLRAMPRIARIVNLI